MVDNSSEKFHAGYSAGKILLSPDPDFSIIIEAFLQTDIK
jgi:hypothetical protein